MGLKDSIIGAGFAAFRLTGLHRLAGAATRGRGAVLMLHHVRPWRPESPGFTPNRLLEITPEFLDDVLVLARRLGFDIVAMDEAAARLADGGAPPFVALTFDDGYRDTVSFALPVLERHRAPFTVFVATGFAERTAGMWWLELEAALRRAGRVAIDDEGLSLDLPTGTPREKTEAFERIYWALRGGSEARLLRVVANLAERHGVDRAAFVDTLCMDWTEIAALASHPLATIGAHSVSHKMLAKWPLDVAREEMRTSKRADRGEARPAGPPFRLSGRRPRQRGAARIRPGARTRLCERGDHPARHALSRAPRSPDCAAARFAQRQLAGCRLLRGAAVGRAVRAMEPRAAAQRRLTRA